MRVYDVNLREGCWTPELVDEALGEASVVKLNGREARILSAALGLGGGDATTDAAAAVAVRAVPRFRYRLDIVCVTHGADGATVWTPDGTASVGGIPISVVDAVGAGDAFTAGFVGRLQLGTPRTTPCGSRTPSVPSSRRATARSQPGSRPRRSTSRYARAGSDRAAGGCHGRHITGHARLASIAGSGRAGGSLRPGGRSPRA
jgi:sugar/nucleoside kinase (ribokinase family)